MHIWSRYSLLKKHWLQITGIVLCRLNANMSPIFIVYMFCFMSIWHMFVTGPRNSLIISLHIIITQKCQWPIYIPPFPNISGSLIHDHGNGIATWWRHQMETFSALLALCAGNSPDTGEFPAQRPVTRSFDVFFDLRLNKRSSKQSWGWWFETLSRPLWRHLNEMNRSCLQLPYSYGRQMYQITTANITGRYARHNC